MKQRLAEHELVTLLHNGDRRALEYLYDNYSAALFGVLKRIVRDFHAAEDLLQESFTKIWLNRSSYDVSKGTLFTWMLSIARHLAIDRLRSSEFRSRALNQSIEDYVGSVHLAADTSFTPETSDMQRLLQMLPEEQKTILDLMYFQGFTQTEIAEEFNIPLGTVKSRSRLALSALRKFFRSES